MFCSNKKLFQWNLTLLWEKSFQNGGVLTKKGVSQNFSMQVL